MTPFIHLRVHSAYSLAEGAIPIKMLPKLCKQHEMQAVALTDSHNLFGSLEFSIACSDVGIQPIIGSTLMVQWPEENRWGSLVVLAKNEVGYLNLMKLVSLPYVGGGGAEESVRHPVAITLKELADHAKGLLILTGGHDGLLGQCLLQGQWKAGKELCTYFDTHFAGHWYVELNRHGLPQQVQIEAQFLDLALDHHVPVVATNQAFFSNPTMYQAHDALLCITQGRYITEHDRRRVTPHHYFKSPQEMVELFSDIPEAITQTLAISQRCSFMPTPRSPILPKFPTDAGCTEETELVYQSELGLARCLVDEVLPLHPKKCHEEVKKQYTDRLYHELSIIKTMGFCGYFLIVSDFIKYAKSKDIPVGPGRGSGAGSLVAWALMITDMDPIRFTLIFERFLNPERVSMPDFDVDFCQDRRDEVIAYVQERYGRDRVAHIITFGKFQAKMAIKDVGRVLQIPYSQADKVSKLIPFNPAHPLSLEQALEAEPQLKQLYNEDEQVKNLIDIAKQVEGLYRHASTHAAGVVIGDRPLVELVPIYKDEQSTLPATQFTMKYAEMAGLVKFDFLGLKTLTVIKKVETLIHHYAAPSSPETSFSIRKIPLDDPATFALLSRVETVGIFQIESAGMRDVLSKLKPDRFEDLIALVALYRPGPMDDIPRYLACKHGEESVTYLHPTLEPILSSTYGVMVYQEQVMQIAQVLGGYTLGGADLLRRAMGKKIKSEMDAQRDLFVKGAIGNGVEATIASLIFDQMAKFAGYGFNKSHSAPYALLSYQTSYLKANYPTLFFAATMTYDMHNVDKLNVYRQDLRNAGITLLPPDINKSGVEFIQEGEKTIRYALSAIKSVGTAGVEQIVAERKKNGPFTSLDDFASRFDPHALNKRQLEPLIGAGAFDTIWPNRCQLYEHVGVMLRHANVRLQERQSRQRTLFDNTNGSSNGNEKGGLLHRPHHQKDKNDQKKGNGFNITGLSAFRAMGQWNLLEKLQKEFESIGFYLSGQPMEAYEDILKTMNLSPSIHLSSTINTKAQMVGMLITKTERTSKAGNKFAFVQFSDTYGSFEVMFFSKEYLLYRDILEAGTAFLIDVSIKRDEDGHVKLFASTLAQLNSLQTYDQFYDLLFDEDVDIKALEGWVNTLPSGCTVVRLGIQLDCLGLVTLTLPSSYSISPARRLKAQSIHGIRNQAMQKD